MAHCKIPTVAAAGSPFRPGSLRSHEWLLPESTSLAWEGKLAVPRGHSTRPAIRKISSITSQPLENRCSSSSSPLPDSFPPQGLSAAEPLSGGGPAASLQQFDKPRSLHSSSATVCPGPVCHSCWGQPAVPCCWFSSQEQRDKLQLLRKKFSLPQPYLGPSHISPHKMPPWPLGVACGTKQLQRGGERSPGRSPCSQQRVGLPLLNGALPGMALLGWSPTCWRRVLPPRLHSGKELSAAEGMGCPGTAGSPTPAYTSGEPCWAVPWRVELGYFSQETKLPSL